MRSPVSFSIEGRNLSGTARAIDTLYDVIEGRLVYKRLKSALEAKGGVYADEYAHMDAVDVVAGIIASGSSLEWFDVPTTQATDEELVDTFMRFIRLNMDVAQAWSDAMTTATRPDNERALLPPEDLTAAELDFSQRDDNKNGTPSSQT